MVFNSLKYMMAIMLFSAVILTGCQNTSGVTDPSQEFVAAANALAQAESDYFDEIQTASDASYRLQAAEDYVGHNGSFTTFASDLSKHDDFSKAKKLRVAAMTQLQNYAQQIAAITSGTNASWISDDAKTTTTSVSTLLNDVGDKGGSQLLTSHAGLIQSAVAHLGQAIISNKSAKELKILATEAKDPISKIAYMVKEDNENIEADKFAESLKADQTVALHNILHFIYEDKNVNSFERFSALQITANWKPSLVTKGEAIQSALKKLQAANDALARKDNISLGALAQQAHNFAQKALNIPSPVK